MKIAFFTETFLPKTDGIVTTLCQTLRQLQKLGHETLIFAPEGGLTEYEGCQVVGMKSRRFPLYPELRLAPPRSSIREILREFKPDILHVADPALLGIAGLYYGGGEHGGELHLPLIIAYHTDLPQYLHYYGLQFLEPYVWKIMRVRHRRATMNLCTSSLMVKQLGEHGIERLALWPGGVDAELFHPSRTSEKMRCQLSQGDPDSPLLLYVGRLSAEKNIESLRGILEAYPRVRLALVGDGPQRKALERHFKDFPVYFAGFLHKGDLASAFASSDIFVMPSRTETLGLVALEAMCSGLPVVAANAGGIPEMIEDGVSGFLFDTEEAAVKLVGKLLRSEDLRASIGRCARVRAAQWSWKAATLKLVGFYEECLRRPVSADTTALSAKPAGFTESMRRAARRSTMFAIRSLLP